MIGDRDFIDTAFLFRDLQGDFGLKTETVRFDLDMSQDLRFKDFIPHFHVGEVEVSEDIGKERQELIANVVPEEKHPMRPAAVKARPENHIGLA